MQKRLFKTNESLVGVLILAIIVIFSIISPEFRSISAVFNILRASIVSSIVALALLLVFISGGIDMSFMSVASVSMYATVRLLTNLEINPPLVVVFLIGAVVGAILGLINALFVTKTDMPIFIVTLATHFIYKGACLAFIGVEVLDVPESMISLSRSNLISLPMPDGSVTNLNSSILIVVALYVLVFLILKYTKFGRKLFALGGDTVAAARSGINVPLTITLMFVCAGVIASVAGILNASLLRLATPGDMIGNELPIMAAVILGGADSAKGRGSVHGTALGVLLIAIISNSLTMLRIPSYWQKAVLGLIVIIGTVLQHVLGKKENA
ncbi:MAG: ABC transporter permease [Lachnospiraceae bacterium]|nr:ABC transporter permease [Lachnospiraceae bacterium]